MRRMAYIKPGFYIKHVFNPLAMRFGPKAKASGVRVLEVPGRTTGEPQRVPVFPIDRGGAAYLVSARGETEWVRNLRAAGGRFTLGGVVLAATEVPVDERPPVLEQYKKQAGRAVARFFVTLPDPADHPVFRLDPAA